MRIRSKTKDETPADRAARLTAWATVWMAILTLIIVGVNLGTLWVLKKQLGEMHDGGVDTHNLALAAKDQSLWTQRLADNMKTQADHTKVLADEALSQARAAERSAIAAGSAAETAGENLRPWIKISDFSPANAHGLLFSKHNGASGYTLSVKLKVLNVGHSPARDISITSWAFTAIDSEPNFDQVDREAHRVCWAKQDSGVISGPPYSTFMFPSESQDAEGDALGEFSPKDLLPYRSRSQREIVPIFVSLCVRYWGAGNTVYHTLAVRQLYRLVHIPGREDAGYAPMIQIGKDLDWNDLSFELENGSHGDFAD